MYYNTQNNFVYVGAKIVFFSKYSNPRYKHTNTISNNLQTSDFHTQAHPLAGGVYFEDFNGNMLM